MPFPKIVVISPVETHKMAGAPLFGSGFVRQWQCEFDGGRRDLQRLGDADRSHPIATRLRPILVPNCADGCFSETAALTAQEKPDGHPLSVAERSEGAVRNSTYLARAAGRTQ